MVRSVVLEINKLKKQYNDKVILDNISMKIKKGDIFGIIGLSGAGKTTLLNTLIGFLEPEKGEVLFLPSSKIKKSSKKLIPLSKDHKLTRQTLGFSSQTPSVYPKLKTQENLDHFGTLYSLKKDTIKKNTQFLLKLTGLTESKDKLAQDLSGGMLKRLDIACALIHNPEILILDEPTADLDPLSRRQIWDLIQKINKQGTTVIISSHLLLELETLCNEISILHGGKIIDSGTVNELKDHYSKNTEIILETFPGNYDLILKELKKKSNITIERSVSKEHKLILYANNAEDVLDELLHILKSYDEKLLDVDVNKPSLSEVFEHLIQK